MREHSGAIPLFRRRSERISVDGALPGSGTIPLRQAGALVKQAGEGPLLDNDRSICGRHCPSDKYGASLHAIAWSDAQRPQTLKYIDHAHARHQPDAQGH